LDIAAVNNALLLDLLIHSFLFLIRCVYSFRLFNYFHADCILVHVFCSLQVRFILRLSFRWRNGIACSVFL